MSFKPRPHSAICLRSAISAFAALILWSGLAHGGITLNLANITDNTTTTGANFQVKVLANGDLLANG
jgi:hypothetical protein